MTFEKFQQFITEQDALFNKLKGTNKNKRERIFVRTIKIGEEYGELCDQVLASFGDQRRGKLERKNNVHLSDEFADVMITTCMLAKAMDIDILEALGHKIEKIRKKHNKQLK